MFRLKKRSFWRYMAIQRFYLSGAGLKMANLRCDFRHYSLFRAQKWIELLAIINKNTIYCYRWFFKFKFLAQPDNDITSHENPPPSTEDSWWKISFLPNTATLYKTCSRENSKIMLLWRFCRNYRHSTKCGPNLLEKEDSSRESLIISMNRTLLKNRFMLSYQLNSTQSWLKYFNIFSL